ncbi:MAG: hypothetical protein PHP46_05765 [Candidatus Omnitrophica bacterium]|nr:hypothetical protein [Candidatus Omnitrophota bacterium]
MLISKGNRQAYPELRGDIRTIRYPAYIEAKIDGELNWFKPDNKCLINKSGKIRSSFPITKELSHIKHRLLGELYWGDGKAGALYEFLKHQTDDELKFMVFDVDMPGTYLDRRLWLIEHISPTPHVRIVDASRALTKDDIEPNYDYYVHGLHYEGIVVKSGDSRLIMGVCPWVKMKNKETSDLPVAYIDPTQERIDVWVQLSDDNRIGKMCGVKVMNKIKATLKIGDIVEIEHQGILSQGGLRHPTFIRKREDKSIPI